MGVGTAAQKEKTWTKWCTEGFLSNMAIISISSSADSPGPARRLLQDKTPMTNGFPNVSFPAPLDHSALSPTSHWPVKSQPNLPGRRNIRQRPAIAINPPSTREPQSRCCRELPKPHDAHEVQSACASRTGYPGASWQVCFQWLDSHQEHIQMEQIQSLWPAIQVCNTYQTSVHCRPDLLH